MGGSMNYITEKERIFIRNDSGDVTAEITFPITDGVAEINHTFVDGSLRGQGIAGELVRRAAEHLTENGYKIHPTCSYAVKWFEKHKEFETV